MMVVRNLATKRMMRQILGHSIRKVDRSTGGDPSNFSFKKIKKIRVIKFLNMIYIYIFTPSLLAFRHYNAM